MQGEETNPAAPRNARSLVARFFAVGRGTCALIGLTVVLVVAVPAARDVVLRQVHLGPWSDALLLDVDAAGAGPTSMLKGWMRSVPELGGSLSVVPRERAAASGEAELTRVAARASESDRDQQAVTAFIARRYRVAQEVVAGFVHEAFRAGREYSVDPLLVLGVMATESRYNPIAVSVMGAKGLMQIIPRFHPEKLRPHGGEDALFDPGVNIRVGTHILREYMRMHGDVETALQMYAGALDEPTSQYARKVLAEVQRLRVVVDRSRRSA